MKTSDKLKAVLCDPEGKIVIKGSNGDKTLLKEAITEVEAQERFNSEGVTPERLREIIEQIDRDTLSPEEREGFCFLLLRRILQKGNPRQQPKEVGP